MASHVEQHFVPSFLLEEWHAPPDSKLTAFRWSRNGLVCHRYKAKSVAKERHLYSMERSRAMPNVELEQRFFGPHVDDPAARVHAKILVSGVRDLAVEDRQAWGPFLMSLMLRVPSMVRSIRAKGRVILSARLDEDRNEYLDVRGEEPEASLREWVEKHSPDLLDDIGVRTLPQLVFSEKLNHAILNSTWATVSVTGARFDLLISDRPLIVSGTFATKFLVALPVSPKRLFLAFSSPETLDRLNSTDKDELVRESNLSSVDGAERYVYGSSARQEAFVRKFLARPADTSTPPQ